MDLSELIENVIPIAEAAGNAVMEVYGREFSVQEKEDRTPLTEADHASNDLIVARLRALTPDIPILSEESRQVPYEERRHWSKLWIVDPLDGTKEFVKRNGEFTVNIALVEDGQPILGVVVAPALATTFAAAKGVGAFRVAREIREAIATKPYESGTLRVVASRSHAGPETEAYLASLERQFGEVETVSKGSSLKLCMIAAGEAHLYPRLGPTMEWDVAAAHAIVIEAGGLVTTLDGHPLTYNKPDLLNAFFVVSGERQILAWSAST